MVQILSRNRLLNVTFKSLMLQVLPCPHLRVLLHIVFIFLLQYLFA